MDQQKTKTEAAVSALCDIIWEGKPFLLTMVTSLDIHESGCDCRGLRVLEREVPGAMLEAGCSTCLAFALCVFCFPPSQVCPGAQQ